eukprot:s649_g34.t1
MSFCPRCLARDVAAAQNASAALQFRRMWIRSMSRPASIAWLRSARTAASRGRAKCRMELQPAGWMVTPTDAGGAELCPEDQMAKNWSSKRSCPVAPEVVSVSHAT